MSDPLAKLEALVDSFDTKSNAEELVQAVLLIVQTFITLREVNEEERHEIRDFLAATLRKIDQKLATVRNGKDGRDGTNGRDGATGAPGRDGRDGTDGRDGRDGSPDTAQEIVAKLESLDGNDRLDASAIKNLPEVTQQIIQHVAGARALSSLADVVVEGIQTGQSIRWNGVYWELYTPSSGGGGTIETPTGLVNGSNTSYTVSARPDFVVADGSTYYEGAGYSYSLGTITMDVAPSSFIRSHS